MTGIDIRNSPRPASPGPDVAIVGSWPSDLHIILLETLSASPNSCIAIHNEELVMKNILKPNSGAIDKERLSREVDMTLLTVPFPLSAATSVMGRL